MMARTVLAGVLLAGLGLRLWGIGFGLPYTLVHPDEIRVVNTAAVFGMGDLNPHYFIRPTLHFYLTAALYGLSYGAGRLSGVVRSLEDFQMQFVVDPSMFYLLPRLMSAGLGVLTLWLVYLVGRRYAGTRCGIVAAGFMGVAFLPVRESHFAAPDTAMVCLLMAGFLAALRIQEAPRMRGAALCGALCGLAISLKYNAAPVLVSALLGWGLGVQGWRRRMAGAAVILGAAGGAFAVTSPYVFLDWASAGPDIREAVAIRLQPMFMDLGPGWRYHAAVSLPHGLGLPLLGAAAAGLGLALVRRRPADVMLLAFTGCYAAALVPTRLVVLRDVLPLAPFLSLAAADLAVRIADRVPRTGLRSPAAALLWVALAAPTAWASVRLDRILAQKDSRVLAREWIERHVPHGSTVASLGYDVGLLPLPESLLEGFRGRLPGVRMPFLARAVRERGVRAYRLVGLGRGDFPGAIYAGGTAREWRANGVRYIVTQDGFGHRYFQNDPALLAAVEQHARRCVTISPAAAGASPAPRFDEVEMFLVPIGGWAGMERPGPYVHIWELP